MSCLSAKYRTITFSLLIRHCFLAFYTTNSFQIQYSTNFLEENVFYLYCTMSEMYYSSFVKGKKDVGVDKIAELTLTASKKHTKWSQVSETKRIGLMSQRGNDSVVRRGSYDEAVLGVELESLANLIKDRRLKDALSKVLRMYVATRGYSKIGYRSLHLDLVDGKEIGAQGFC